MPPLLSLPDKLAILADAAKYDASCASSAAPKRHSRGGGLGSTTGAGICHAYTPDGRCVSLLKILLTNACIFDCAYCVSRRSSNVRRARFTVEEVVDLTLGFYKRNCVEGLFLSSGIIKSPDYTMEQLVLVAKSLRLEHGFKGYIHLKTIPEAAVELIEEAGRFADRLSINVELPSEAGLKRLAPEKRAPVIRASMQAIGERIRAAKAERGAPAFSPSGQSTQMIVGADATDDGGVLAASTVLYREARLKRVYYSAFSPIGDASADLPLQSPPLLREHRLYQADWLLRFYGFDLDEVMRGAEGGHLRLDVDPKRAWALVNRDRFPIDLNRAPRETLLRVPGLGVRTVERLLMARRLKTLRLDDLRRVLPSYKKTLPFVVLADHRPADRLILPPVREAPVQLQFMV